MQIFPIPPTDNIFKFSAIFGLIGSSISFLLFIYFSYLLAHLEVAGKLLMPSYRAQETLDKVNCRAAAIANGRFEICKFEEFKYLNIVDGSQREIEYLEHIKKSQGEIVAEYENHAKISSPISDNIRWIINDKIVLVLLFIPAAFFWSIFIWF